MFSVAVCKDLDSYRITYFPGSEYKVISALCDFVRPMDR